MSEMPENEGRDVERLQRMLEEVTASDRAHPAPHDDPEAAGLREAWLAFGRLLEAADEAQSGNWNPEIVRQKEPLRTQPAERGRLLAPMVAAAAAICLAIGLGWWMSRSGQPNGNGPAVVRTQQKPDQPQDVRPPQPKPVVPNVPAPSVAQGETNKPQQATAATKSSVWDDAIDTQITALSQQIDLVRQTWQHRVDDADLVQYRIDEVSDGMSDNAL
jgi:hypothetical protein